MKVLGKWKCTLKNYPTEIQVSAKKRAIFWKSTDVLPKKYSDKTLFNFGIDGALMNMLTGEKIIKNSKTAGKPRLLTINAQKIYVGIHHSVRSKIVNELHKLFNNAFKKQLPPKIDLQGNKILISLHFYDQYSTKLPDLDNLANLFVKCGIDCLTTPNNPNQTSTEGTTHKLSIIPDDKMAFIPHIVSEFTPVDKIEDRRLEFTLYLVTPNFSLEPLLDSLITEDEESK